jgi:hypothetical protein
MGTEKHIQTKHGKENELISHANTWSPSQGELAALILVLSPSWVRHFNLPYLSQELQNLDSETLISSQDGLLTMVKSTF